VPFPFRRRRGDGRAPPVPRSPFSPDVTPDKKAELLLWSKLTDAQRRTYWSGYFDVTGSLGGQYRIHLSSTVQNITVRREAEYCVTVLDVPRHDVWLFQKVLIESDEDRFLRAAVRYPRCASVYDEAFRYM